MALSIEYGTINMRKFGGPGSIQRVKLTGLTVPSSAGEGEMHTGTAVDVVDYGYINVSGASKITVWVRNAHASLDANVYVYGSLMRVGLKDAFVSTTANPASELTATHVASEWTNIPYDPDGNAYVTATHEAAAVYMIIQGPWETLKIRGVSSAAAFIAGLDAYVDIQYNG